MKILKNVFRVLTVVFAAAAFVLFFFDFGKVILNNGTEVVRAGTQFAFGSSYEGIEIAQSVKILFSFILTAFTLLFAGLSLKFKGTRWATIGFAVVDAIYMLVVACSEPFNFLDLRGFSKLPGAHSVYAEYVNLAPMVIAGLLFLTLISAIVYLLAADKLEVAGTDKLPIVKRVVKFLRDYKGELKKITWPGLRAVVKNTVIVLIMCAICGLFIWAVDYGLGAILKLVYGG